MISFQKPIPWVNMGAGSEGDWWSVEEKIEGICIDDDSKTATIITLTVSEDTVSCVARMCEMVITISCYGYLVL